MGFFRRELLYVLVLMCGSAFVGESLAFFSPAGPKMTIEFGWRQSLGSLFNSLSSITAIVGGPLTNLVVPRLGRRLPCVLYAAVAAVTWIVVCVTRRSFFWLAFLARAVQGLCVGGLSSLCSMYIVEISPAENRGAYGTLHQLGVTLGMAYVYLVGIFCTWRLTTGLCCVFPALLACLVWLIPESPAVARAAAALKSGQDNLDNISNNSNNSNISNNGGNGGNDNNSQAYLILNESLFQRKYIRSLVASLLFMFFQQFSGINALGTNLESIFKSANVDLDPSLSAFLVGISQCVSTALTSFLVKKVGKKAVMLVSAIGQAAALILVWVQELWHINSVISIVALIVDYFFFGIGFGPVPWFIVPELFPDSVRQLAVSIFTGINWAFVTIIIFMWPPMQDSIGLGWGLFVYAVICVAGFVWGIFWMPDATSEQQDNSKKDESELPIVQIQQNVHEGDVNVHDVEITADEDPEPAEL